VSAVVVYASYRRAGLRGGMQHGIALPLRTLVSAGGGCLVGFVGITWFNSQVESRLAIAPVARSRAVGRVFGSEAAIMVKYIKPGKTVRAIYRFVFVWPEHSRLDLDRLSRSRGTETGARPRARNTPSAGPCWHRPARLTSLNHRGGSRT